MFEGVVSSLAGNQFFGAGAGLLALGLLTNLTKKGAQYGVVLARRKFLVSMEVNSKDISFSWLLNWISKHAPQHHLSVKTTFEQNHAGRISTDYSFVPCPGTHFFWFRGLPIKVERERQKQSVDLSKSTPFETVTLTTLFFQRNVLNTILEEARVHAFDQHEGKTVIYTAIGHEWRTIGHPQLRRPLESVILDGSIKENIVNDVKEFLMCRNWYIERGIPYRRGYLFYGPPGCGKTSFITALAGYLDYSIAILNLSEATLTDDRLNYLLVTAPPETIILLEDVDSAFHDREAQNGDQVAYQGLTRLTFSGLLNALDGVTSSDGRILCMTTNYIERLDSALIRPGRVDFKQYIGHCTDIQLQSMFRKFYPEASISEASEFSKRLLLLGVNISAAQIQGYFLLHKNDSHLAVKNIDTITKKF